ncbi:MAG: hypothetical protein K2N74_01640, partial [Clostridiales bacterium]|nr:hypothetical protein [Clostridiales bacterium]
KYALEDLFKTVTGDANVKTAEGVADYINDHYHGYLNQGTTAQKFTAREGVEIFGSKIVTAPKINANAGNPNYGVVVKLRGEEWSVTSLTIDDEGNPVATLLLSSPTKTAQFNTHSNQTAKNDVPSNMYSTSSIRNGGLQALYPNFVGDWANTYLVTPSHIKYQEIQNMSGWPFGYTIKSNGYQKWGTVPNDGWGDPQDPAFINQYVDYTKKSGYGDWKDDTIWIPGFTELCNKSSNGTLGIWNLADDQLCFGDGKKGSVFMFTRSGQFDGLQASTADPSGKCLEVFYPNGENN